eukprot:scaffold1120_cov127-Cylindrotheca_fusiformis.AAC.6
MESKPNQRKVFQNGSKQNGSTCDVRVTYLFLWLSLLAGCLIAFIVGRTTRIQILKNPQSNQFAFTTFFREAKDRDDNIILPHPVVTTGMDPYKTGYFSENFDTSRSASIISRFIEPEDEGTCKSSASAGASLHAQSSACLHPDMEEEKAEYEQTGQHLLVDIVNVDTPFLDSKERLSVAMLDLLKQCGQTLLSYHCHDLQPNGVSCAGVLMKGHISFHTWPSKGVITLDLYISGPDTLLPFVSVVKTLFAVPSLKADGQPRMVWSHKFRGFSEDINEEVAERSDFFRFPIGMMTDYKEQVVSAVTDFQQVDIYDVIRPKFQTLEAYEKSMLNDGSYESEHPRLFEPDRIVFLDGILQSRRSGDAAYHESLVHPGMIAHPNPKRVAIIGGGEGATLREVLKHKTLETVVMVEIDKQMVDLSMKHLPFWSDCSAITGNVSNCFDDPRVDAYYEDAFKWFIDRFSGDGIVEEERFDVIIMDALDPQVQVDIVEALYDGGPFLSSLPKGLRDDGILIAQVGEAPRTEAPAEDYSWHRNRVKFIKTLIDTGFESIRDYEEFIVAFKDFQSRAGWFMDEAMVDVQIHQRIFPTEKGESSLKYFDGATMLSYRFPSKTSERVFCLRESKSGMCNETKSASTSLEGQQLVVARLRGIRGESSTTVNVSVVDTDDVQPTRENVLRQHFSGENTYNPLAERHPLLYPNAIPLRKQI